MLDSTVPTPAEVAAIVASSDPVLRNLRITEGYHRLSRGILATTGDRGINWCTLGTWASKSTGRFVRGGEVPTVFRGLIDGSGRFVKIESSLEFNGLARRAGGTKIESNGDDDNWCCAPEEGS